jgi:hypothetical protein
MTMDPRDHLLEAMVARLRAQKNTQSLADHVEAELRSLQRAERAVAEWDATDRADMLNELAADGAARLRSRRKWAKPTSHLAGLRRQWDQLTRSIKSAFATAPSDDHQAAYLRGALQTMWCEFLGHTSPPARSILDYALDAADVRNIAFRLLEKAHRWKDPENVRRSLRRS